MSEVKLTPQEIVLQQLEVAKTGSLISATFLGELVIVVTSTSENHLFSADLVREIEESSDFFADAITHKAVLAILQNKIIPEQKKPLKSRNSSTAAKSEGGISTRTSTTNTSGEVILPPKPAPTQKK